MEEQEFPPTVIDEAIVNAITHRDYRTGIPIECESYSDAFLVKNPGRMLQRDNDLPNEFSLSDTVLNSMPRNAKLIEWLKLMKDPDGVIYLSTTGYNPFRRALGTPKPLEVSAWIHRPEELPRAELDLRVLAVQVLNLTKLNWASTDSFCGEPITLKYAGNIAYLTAAFLRQSEPFNLHPVLEKTPWFI